MSKRLSGALLLALCACAPAAPASIRTYSEPVVLFVSPDSTAVEALKTRLGEDFYVVADDAMWYRSEAFTLLDSLAIPHEMVDAGPVRFRVGGKLQRYEWTDVEASWYAVLYDGSRPPVFSFGADLTADLRRLND